MAKKLHIVGFSGSLRKASYNSALLHAAQELMPDDAELEIISIADIPFFNEDVEKDGMPAPVQAFRDKLQAADAILIAMPEYNYSMPGVLKNALDWASRPDANKVMPVSDKPFSVIGASSGAYGTARGQHHLRQTSVNMNMHPLTKPEVMVTFADKKIVDGKLTDEPTRKVLKDHLEALITWTRRLQK